MKKIKLTVKVDKNDFKKKLELKDSERVEVIKEQPIVTNEIKEVAKYQTSQEIRDALESLKKGEKLSIQAIEDLSEIIEELRKKSKDLGGGGGFTSPVYNFIDDETLAGTINSTNTVFTISRLPYRGSVKIYRGGARQRVGEDYTLSADQKTITFIVAPDPGEILLADYRTL